MSGEGAVLEIRTHTGRGRGWFKNPSFWRTSYVECRRPLISSFSTSRLPRRGLLTELPSSSLHVVTSTTSALLDYHVPLPATLSPCVIFATWVFTTLGIHEIGYLYRNHCRVLTGLSI